MLIRLILVAVGYLFGLIQTGFFYGKITGVDLARLGSGNRDATNALRTVGVKGAVIICFIDAMKAFLPCAVVWFLFKSQGSIVYVYQMYMAFGVTLGNDFPFYLKFKGGKGVASTCGWVLAWNMPIWCIGMASFFLIAFTTRIVSIASLFTAVVIIVSGFIFDGLIWPDNFWNGDSIEFIGLIIIMALLLIIRHSDNIRRLFNGTEYRFEPKTKQKEPKMTEEEKKHEEEIEQERQAELEIFRNKVAQNAVRDRAPETDYPKKVFTASGFKDEE